MTFYEHTFIGKQDLSNKEVENLITKYSELINKTGKILKTEKWGLLNLATKINKNNLSSDSKLNWAIRFLPTLPSPVICSR